MADFCKECSERLFDKDFGDMANLCGDGEMVGVLCEGCGYIWVDKNGKRIDFEDEEE